MDSAGDDGGATWEGSTKTGVELWDVSGSSEYVCREESVSMCKSRWYMIRRIYIGRMGQEE